MPTLLKAAGDRLLEAIAPKRRASACSYPTYCAFQFRGCGGGYCYYYYQWGQYCYVGDHQLTGCTNYMRRYQGCC